MWENEDEKERGSENERKGKIYREKGNGKKIINLKCKKINKERNTSKHRKKEQKQKNK